MMHLRNTGNGLLARFKANLMVVPIAISLLQMDSHCGVSLIMVVLEKELVLTCKQLLCGLDTLILEYLKTRRA